MDIPLLNENVKIDKILKTIKLDSLTESKKCSECESSDCPGKKISKNELKNIDEYPCFIKAYLFTFLSTDLSKRILLNNLIFKYLKTKTTSVYKDATKRASYGNFAVILSLIKDFLKKRDADVDYLTDKGLHFSKAQAEIRSYPWGGKIQNHPFNHRLNTEFINRFETEPIVILVPIKTKKGTTHGNTYKINTDYLEVDGISKEEFAKIIRDVISLFIILRTRKDDAFLGYCESLLEKIGKDEGKEETVGFLTQQIKKCNARIFELVSFCILKTYFRQAEIYFGKNKKSIKKMRLNLYKTGRTNANDGGIDFVLNPVGGYFQVSQDFNFKKYFLDIDKINKFPITLVINTDKTPKEALEKIKNDSRNIYEDKETRKNYLNSIREIYTNRSLLEILEKIKKDNKNLKDIIQELILQYKIEFNIPIEKKFK